MRGLEARNGTETKLPNPVQTRSQITHDANHEPTNLTKLFSFTVEITTLVDHDHQNPPILFFAAFFPAPGRPPKGPGSVCVLVIGCCENA